MYSEALFFRKTCSWYFQKSQILNHTNNVDFFVAISIATQNLIDSSIAVSIRIKSRQSNLKKGQRLVKAKHYYYLFVENCVNTVLHRRVFVNSNLLLLHKMSHLGVFVYSSEFLLESSNSLCYKECIIPIHLRSYMKLHIVDF